MGRSCGVILCCLVLAAGCAYLGYLKDPFVDIPGFYRVNEALYRGGQPDGRGWQRLHSLDIKTVVSLRGENKDSRLESEATQSMGMRSFVIPMSVYTAPSDEQVIKFLEIILEPSNRPVFVHCDSGRDRTGAMIALYRVVVDGWTIKRAYREARNLGFFPYHGKEAPLKTFVHQLKDKQEYFQKAREFKAR
ncbi:MAG: tyrosine-protein phosphatase [Candidatus Omnitrophica bacterium]|nr:tyrosine-protein phosphatase [Candidatus Omnitrophota bacterium]